MIAKGRRPGDFLMGVVTLTGMFRNCVRASHPAQPRPAQRFFSFVFWEGGKGKGGGDQAGGSEESASRKNPGKQAGTSNDGALSMSPTQAPGIPTSYSSFVFFCGCPVYTTTTTTTTSITLIL